MPVPITKIAAGRRGDPDYRAYDREDLLTEYYSRPRDQTYKEWRTATAKVAEKVITKNDMYDRRRAAVNESYDRDAISQRINRLRNGA